MGYWSVYSCHIDRDMVFDWNERECVGIGFKTRVEFYLFQVLQNVAGSILTPLFRVLFPEVFPKGLEIQYFGFQMVVSTDNIVIHLEVS
jgi:hypothetical protein